MWECTSNWKSSWRCYFKISPAISGILWYRQFFARQKTGNESNMSDKKSAIAQSTLLSELDYIFRDLEKQDGDDTSGTIGGDESPFCITDRTRITYSDLYLPSYSKTKTTKGLQKIYNIPSPHKGFLTFCLSKKTFCRVCYQ